MRWGRQARLAFGIGLIVFGLIPAAAESSHYSTPVHWRFDPHDFAFEARYWIADWTLPNSSWNSAIQAAASTWTSTDMDFVYQGTVANAEWWDTGTHIVWYGAIPNAWVAYCPRTDTYACTNWVPVTEYTDRNPLGWQHMEDSDTVFSNQYTSTWFRTDSTSCLLNIGVDVQSGALHEFGHWGVLAHDNDPILNWTTESSYVMWPLYTGCKRNLAGHDILSMNFNYHDPPE